MIDNSSGIDRNNCPMIWPDEDDDLPTLDEFKDDESTYQVAIIGYYGDRRVV